MISTPNINPQFIHNLELRGVKRVHNFFFGGRKTNDFNAIKGVEKKHDKTEVDNFHQVLIIAACR